MKMKILSLELQFKQGSDIINFSGFSYFYGKMGAGKTSIARLIDYCLGGDLDLSPALQSEFISAKLNLFVNDTHLALERVRNSDQVVAEWSKKSDTFSIVIPAKTAKGEIIPHTGIENLSDLLFYLSGIRAPKVRKNKSRDDSELNRLSIRNLLWYCYLDQDSMDSSFFNLDADAVFYLRNTSKDVLRYVIGFHQEQVAELEAELQEIREKRLGLLTGAKSLRMALDGEGIGDKTEIEKLLNGLEIELEQVKKTILLAREQNFKRVPHQIDILQQKARHLFSELISITDAISTIESTLDGDQRHLNELQMLKVKFRKASSARSILAGVEFSSCPRCSQKLPAHPHGFCPICGQSEPEQTENNLDLDVLESDAKTRIQELKESIERHSEQLVNLRRRHDYLSSEKQTIDQEMNDVMREYDSAYLSTTLGVERRKAEIEQTIFKLGDYLRLTKKVDDLYKEASILEGQEIDIRRKLREARALAEQDTSNLKKLEGLFLDCLLRSRWPGVKNTDEVVIEAPHFLPEVISPDVGDLAVTSFSNISSGGKKSLFKSCFAIAMHRLAVDINAVLPTLLIIDSPMKNISERENREEFEGFHKMLYDLAETELKETQFILIDKEFLLPGPDSRIDFQSRHMTPDDPQSPPLIRYYKGH